MQQIWTSIDALINLWSSAGCTKRFAYTFTMQINNKTNFLLLIVQSGFFKSGWIRFIVANFYKFKQTRRFNRLTIKLSNFIYTWPARWSVVDHVSSPPSRATIHYVGDDCWWPFRDEAWIVTTLWWYFTWLFVFAYLICLANNHRE